MAGHHAFEPGKSFRLLNPGGTFGHRFYRNPPYKGSIPDRIYANEVNVDLTASFVIEEKYESDKWTAVSFSVQDVVGEWAIVWTNVRKWNRYWAWAL